MAELSFKRVFDEMMAAPLGGEIQEKASELHYVGEDSGHGVIQCLDGRRCLLQFNRLNDGCKYSYKTGKPLKKK